MFLKVKLEDVQRRYPDAVQIIEQQIRQSRSKHRDSPLTTFTWGFDWAVRVQPLIVSAKGSDWVVREPGPYKEHQAFLDLPLDEQVQDYASRCSVCLKASWGSGRWETLIPDVPHEILDFKRQCLELPRKVSRC